MPVLSMFYGIIVQMFSEIGGKHHKPHIHVKYSDQKAVVSLDGEILDGEIPKNKMKLLEAWIELHHDELLANWELLSSGDEYFRIDPLKEDTSMEPRILSVKPLPDYKLRLDYESGETKIFDVTPYIRGNWFNELSDRAYFNAVRIIDGGDGIEWPHGQDLAPHELYELSIPVL